ncbi:DUF2157 domain-containing protein [Haloarcula nitratireducens]|uniref:DUF2157 domain-containing protein n=1 Tax=Haloarcula nitratireducens TaxID=2487749 RepID=A0AAW4PDC5_9EURY|nr:DUF2157 domain-containing protein [Halomicroarcula nitratireducens]MBX0295919.1 DUF2157 domain-containing protein [Halomicroarcula nitratireducens]
MKLQIDSGKLLYALGVLFAAAAFLYFVRDVVFGLSITVKAVLLFLAFVAFFVAGVTVDRDVLDVVAFALSGVAYVVFVGYVVLRYGPSETGTFLLLAVSAALFVTLGYLLRQQTVDVPRRTATGVVVALLLVSAVLVGVDALGGDVTYDLRTEESVTVSPPVRAPDSGYVNVDRSVGTMTATNSFVFTRALSLPTLDGCLVGTDAVPRDDVWLSYEFPDYDRPDTIAGGTSREFGVRASIPVDVNQTGPATVAIERGTDCTVDRSSPTLIVSAGEEDLRRD